MIKALLLVSSIIGGVGLNASPSLNEKAQKEIDTQYKKQMDNTSSTSEQPSYPSYNITIQPNFKQVIHTEWQYDFEGTDYDYYQSYLIQKNQSNYSNSVYRVNASKYTLNNIVKKQSKYDSSSNFGFFWEMMYNTATNTGEFIENFDMDMYVIELDPVNKANNNNLTFSFKNTCGLDIWTSPSQQDLDIYLYSRIDIINTSDDYASKYVDASISSGTRFNTWWQDILDNVNDRTDQVRWDNTKIAEYNHGSGETTNYTPTKTITANITTNENTTNYIYIKVVRQVKVFVKDTETEIHNINLENWQLYDQWGTRDNGYFNYYYSHDNVITLSGTYQPGTAVEVIDLPGLMFTILGMPFTFLSTAFNLTLFPNTPYSINISSFIWTILGIVLLLCIIRLILKVFR